MIGSHIVKQHIRALGKKLELATYQNDKQVVFAINSQIDLAVGGESSVSVPLPLMYRYYHIGRAYDLHQLKNLHPTGASSVDFLSMQLLIQELQQVAELIDDPVLHHYSARLVAYLVSARSDTKSKLLIRAS